MTNARITIAETNAFVAQAKTIFSEAERQEVINMIAADPKCGALIRETGGVRKVRIALPGRGKSGGARVVYFYHNGSMPLYLLAVFAKNEKDNLSKAERNELRKMTEAIIRLWNERMKK